MRYLLLGLFTISFGGCFVPPPLELEADGGGSNAPEVLPITIPDPYKTHTIQQTPPGKTPNVLSINLAVFDRDSATLFVRLFVDGYPYDKEVGANQGGNCSSVKPKGCAVRLDVPGVCDDVVNNVLGTHIMEGYVTDQPWSDEDKNDLRKTVPGGFRTNVWWRLECIEPVGTSDGGMS